MQIKRIASTNKNCPFLIGYWLRGQATPLLAPEFCEFAVSTISRVQGYSNPHDWVAAMRVTSASPDTTEVRYFFDWVPLI